MYGYVMFYFDCDLFISIYLRQYFLNRLKMPKRPASTDEEFTQPIKKQQNSKTKSRNIRSLSSGRSPYQVLYFKNKFNDQNNIFRKKFAITL